MITCKIAYLERLKWPYQLFRVWPMISVGSEFLYGVPTVHVGREKCFVVRTFVTPVLWVEMIGGRISDENMNKVVSCRKLV